MIIYFSNVNCHFLLFSLVRLWVTLYFIRYLRSLVFFTSVFDYYLLIFIISDYSSRLRGVNAIHSIVSEGPTKKNKNYKIFLKSSQLRSHDIEHVIYSEPLLEKLHNRDQQSVERLFKANIFASDPVIEAEALSHLTLWRHIAATQNEMHLVLTDDAAFVDGWMSKWNTEYGDDLPHDALVSMISFQNERRNQLKSSI